MKAFFKKLKCTPNEIAVAMVIDFMLKEDFNSLFK